MKPTAIDIHSWPRAEHYAFFKDFSQPYFQVCVRLKAKVLYDYCRAKGLSFFHAYCFLAQRSAIEYQPMGLRLVEEGVWHYPSVTAGVVQLAGDDTFRFSYFEPLERFTDFAEMAQKASVRAKSAAFFSEDFASKEGHPDALHISVLPWIDFTSFSHAFDEGESFGIPKLVFGKYDGESGSMPLAVDVHHALMDGLHTGRFIALLQEKFDDPARYLG